MQAYVTLGAGFLLAVLWFDLMFDVQARGGATDDDVASIATYYARVTTAASPMSYLVALAMLGTLAAVIAELVADGVPAWATWPSLGLVLAPVILARVRTVPGAVSLGRGDGAPEARRALAESILRQHLFCFACIATVVALQVASLALD